MKAYHDRLFHFLEVCKIRRFDDLSIVKDVGFDDQSSFIAIDNDFANNLLDSFMRITSRREG